MSSLRAPGRGPIVGHTTATTCRIWIRGANPDDEGVELAENRRTIGVIAVTHENGRLVPKRARKVHYFRLHREFDRTGTFNLGSDASLDGQTISTALKPDTEYVVRVGTLSIDDPFPNDESVSDQALGKRLPRSDEADWFEDLSSLPGSESEARFRTFPEKSENLSFILGSCRYPGILWKVKEADRIFGPLLQEAQGKGPAIDGDPAERGPASLVLMVGDQIYADMLNRKVPLARADTFAEFQERYITAFGSRNMRALLRQIPNYMILDDHEIEDNWTQDRIGNAESREVFNHAISAYLSYQWSHGPRTFGRRLFYQFDYGDYPFFVLDTRTQRYMDDIPGSLDDNHMLGRPSLDPAVYPSQLEILLQWLETCQKTRGNIPKFIVSSSVFVPNPMSAREGRDGEAGQKIRWKQESDSWPGFPATRKKILSCIVNNRVQNVIFLSGDIHCSNVAEMKFSGKAGTEKIKAFSVTSSAFYWPFPFADGEPSSYVHDSSKPEQKDSFSVTKAVEMNYKAWNFTQEDNYCRVDVDRANQILTIRAFNQRGNLIEEGGWFFGGKSTPMIAKLALASW